MLITETVEVKCFSRNKKHLLSKGYKYKYGETIQVKTLDMAENSPVEIDVKCDYCFEDYKTTIQSFNCGKEIVDKDACPKCRGLKTKESNLIQYGVESITDLSEIQNKRSKKMIKHTRESIKKTVEENNCTFIEVVAGSGARSKVTFKCNIHEDSIQTKRYDSILEYGCCKFCNHIKQGENLRGINHPNWQGGKTSIQTIIRNMLLDWKIKVLESNSYKCDISEKGGSLEVHHLYGFNKILNDVITKFKVDIDNLSDKERDLVINKVLEVHQSEKLGIPLKKEIHQEFHSIYGKGNNTPEQYLEFKENYKILNEYKECIINGKKRLSR